MHIRKIALLGSFAAGAALALAPLASADTPITSTVDSEITSLKDPNDSSYNFAALYDTVKLKAYQFRVVASGAHFIPLGKQSTIKLGIQGGWYQSPRTYRNELFLIGGYKLLRGFNEESQYVSQYAIGTVEYRYRLGLNSYFFGLGQQHQTDTLRPDCVPCSATEPVEVIEAMRLANTLFLFTPYG